MYDTYTVHLYLLGRTKSELKILPNENFQKTYSIRVTA